jgi:hypothetical protein
MTSPLSKPVHRQRANLRRSPGPGEADDVRVIPVRRRAASTAKARNGLSITWPKVQTDR